MKIKKYIAQDMKSALKRIREELGKDALILSNKKIDGGRIEILASKDSSFMNSTVSINDGIISKINKIAVEQDTQKRITSSFDNKVTQLNHFPSGSSVSTHDKDNHSRVGVINEVVLCEENLFEAPGIFVLLGLPGAGKTTTIAKIAAMMIQRHGTEKVRIMSTDDKKWTTKLQMHQLGQHLGIITQTIDVNYLLNNITELPKDEWIFIDTEGTRLENLEKISTLIQKKSQFINLKLFLTYSAVCQENILSNKIIESYSDCFSGMILTQCDLVTDLSPILKNMNSYIPLALYCDGAIIPDDVHVVTENTIKTWIDKKRISNNFFGKVKITKNKKIKNMESV
ncbi:MAG: hypothetical protein V4629_04035 [Pseudomonadota bacterium]